MTKKRLPFKSLIRELLEVFVGRDEDVKRVKALIREHESGVFWIPGEPGVGKSALMAKLTEVYEDDSEDLLLIPYFFRLGHSGCSTVEFLRTALSHLHTALGKPGEISSVMAVHELIPAFRDAGGKLNRKILFLIDGLDEIHRSDPGFVSLMLGGSEAVWVCAGRRETDIEDRLDDGGAERIFPDGLCRLDGPSVRAMLTAHLDQGSYSGGEIADAQSEEFVGALIEKSEGLPLFVRMLVEDMKRGALKPEENLPDGLSAYYERILDRLRGSDVGNIVGEMFCLLAYAKTPVTEPALKTLLSERDFAQDRGWGGELDKALAYGRFMLRSGMTPDGVPGWTLYHDTFRHHLLTSERVSRFREHAKSDWLKWLGRWENLNDEVLRRYALRHYPGHLSEAGEYETLFDLARNNVFLQTQGFSDPGLSLQILQAALKGAVEGDDGRLMAEFLLAHARQLIRIREESPLDALHKGDLKRAWELAGIENCAEWYLLLAWVLKDMGRTEDAEETLGQLWKKEELPPWGRDDVDFLVLQVFDISESVFAALCRSLYVGKANLCKYLIEHNDFDRAFEVATQVKNSRELSDIAKAMGKAGEVEKARAVFDHAIEAAKIRTFRAYVCLKLHSRSDDKSWRDGKGS